MREIYKSATDVAMYYKKVNNIGIRRKKPRPSETNGRRIFTFGAGLGLTKSTLQRWGGRVIKRLDEGSTEDAARQWIDARMAAYR